MQHVTDQPTSHEQGQHAENVKQQAADAANDAQRQAAEVQAELKRQAAELSETARRKALEAAEQAKTSGANYAREKKTRIADELGILSDAIRKASDKLHEENHDSIACYVDAAAKQIDRYRQMLQSKDVREMISDAQDVARGRPELVYGGMFVAGIAAMRFLKSSAPPRRSPDRDLSRHDQRPAEAFGHAPDSITPSPTSSQSTRAWQTTEPDPKSVGYGTVQTTNDIPPITHKANL